MLVHCFTVPLFHCTTVALFHCSTDSLFRGYNAIWFRKSLDRHTGESEYGK